MKKINPKKHFEIIDLARGFAILLMFVYHFSYDLDYFNFIQQNFASGIFWTNFRTLIVTMFLLVMGISLYLASYTGLNKKRFQRRLMLLLIYSLLVSFSSWIMFPNAMILIGILHFIAIASVLGLLFIPLGKINLFLGVLFILAGQFLEFPIFNQTYLHWIGFMTLLPITVDYVPLFPWLGVVLIGLYLGQIISQCPTNSFVHRWQNRQSFTKVLALAGRHSLHIYILHQPLFLGILYILSLAIN